MRSRRLTLTLFCALFSVGAPSVARAAHVLDNLPVDSLGFLVVRNLGATNAKAERLLQSLRLQFPGPLALMKSAVGIADGLDPDGDLLLAVLPGDGPAARMRFGIWLPVSDYDQLVASLDGTPAGEITAIAIAGEDLLIGHRGEWALVVDPDQRDRLQRWLASPPAPPAQISAWRDWLEHQDVAVAALPAGLRTAWDWASIRHSDDAAAAPPESAPGAADDRRADNVDELFAAVEESGSMAGDFWSLLRQQVRQQLVAAPQLASWAAEAQAMACGIRIDAEGNTTAGLRVILQNPWTTSLADATASDLPTTPPSIFPTGDFLVSGAGKLPTRMVVAAAGTYARLRAESLRNDIQVQIDDDLVADFQNAVEHAAAEVTAASVLTLPGENGDGIFSNEFLAVRVREASEFVRRVDEAVKSWNEMNKSQDENSRVIFESEETQISGHAGTHYSVDMAEAVGAAAIPEVRPSMERLFGPGGKLRLIVVPIDDQTVLLAGATPEQAKPIVDMLAQKEPIRWDERTNRLLPNHASWRLMASPHGRTRWLKRQMDAMLGPVIGGPIVHQFPPSPPIGAAGGFAERGFWIDAAIPAETIRAAGEYIQQR